MCQKPSNYTLPPYCGAIISYETFATYTQGQYPSPRVMVKLNNKWVTCLITARTEELGAIVLLVYHVFSPSSHLVEPQ